MSICSPVAKGCTIIVITAAVLFGGAAQAARKSADMTVQFNVNTDCTIAVDGVLDFGTVSTTRIAANLDADTTLTVNCSAGVRYELTINNGNNPDGANRRMVGTASPAMLVPYMLYINAGRTVVWTQRAATGHTGNGSDQTIEVYGRIPSAAPTPKADRYTDTVTVTLSY